MPKIALSIVTTQEVSSCQPFRGVGNESTYLYGTGTDLDAGTITLNGPNITNQQLTETANSYSLSIDTVLSGISVPGYPSTPAITAGTYTLTGGGGAGVGKFTVGVKVGSPLTITSNGGSLPATVSRASNLTVSFTGGNTTDLVYLLGFSGTVLNAGSSALNSTYDSAGFICGTTAGAGSITVPASILAQLPATPTGATGAGALLLVSSTAPSSSSGTFTAPLTAGGNTTFALFLGTFGALALSMYQ